MKSAPYVTSPSEHTDASAARNDLTPCVNAASDMGITEVMTDIVTTRCQETSLGHLPEAVGLMSYVF